MLQWDVFAGIAWSVEFRTGNDTNEQGRIKLDIRDRVHMGFFTQGLHVNARNALAPLRMATRIVYPFWELSSPCASELGEGCDKLPLLELIGRRYNKLHEFPMAEMFIKITGHL